MKGHARFSGDDFGLLVDFGRNSHSDYCGLCRHMPTIAHMTPTCPTSDSNLPTSEVWAKSMSNDYIAFALPQIIEGRSKLTVEDQLAIMVENYKRANS